MFISIPPSYEQWQKSRSIPCIKNVSEIVIKTITLIYNIVLSIKVFSKRVFLNFDKDVNIVIIFAQCRRNYLRGYKCLNNLGRFIKVQKNKITLDNNNVIYNNIKFSVKIVIHRI